MQHLPAGPTSPAFPEEDIFVGNLPFADEPAGSGDDDDAGILEAIPPSSVPLTPLLLYPSQSSWTCVNERLLA